MNLSLVFGIYLLSAIKACEIQKISSDPVERIEFDGLYTHIVSTEGSKTKVNQLFPAKNSYTYRVDEIPMHNFYVITSKRSDFYIGFQEIHKPNKPILHDGMIIHFSEKGSIINFPPLPDWFCDLCGNTKNFIDKDYYVFINTDKGVSLINIAENQRDLTIVKNLHNYTFRHHVEDEEGNVYLASNEVDSLFVIKREEKSSVEPYAKKIPDSSNKPISKLVKGYGNNIMAVYNTENLTAEIRNITMKETKKIFDYLRNRYYGNFLRTGKTLFFIGVSMKTNITRFYMAREGGNVFITELKDMNFDREREIAVTDSNDDAFFVYNGGLLFVPSNSTLIPIIIKMEIPNNTRIYSLVVGKAGYIWILAKDLYLISKKSEIILFQVLELSITGVKNTFPILTFNKVPLERLSEPDKGSTQIFIGTDNGLYTCLRPPYNGKRYPLLLSVLPCGEVALASRGLPNFFLVTVLLFSAMRTFQLFL